MQPRLRPPGLTQTVVAVTAASGTLIGSNPNREFLSWMNIGASPVTVAPGSAAAVYGQGMIFQPGSSVAPQEGAAQTFDAVVPTGPFQAVCATGQTTTLVVWEG